MNSRPLVSVITPFFNSVRFLEEAIESVLAQSYPEWELLLVDDGSTDASSLMARRCADQHLGRVRYLDHEGHRNVGLAASRNLGLRSARGDYIALLDSDDVWLPEKLERQVGLLRAQAEAALVYGRSQYWSTWSTESPSGESDEVPELGVHIPLDTLMKPPTLLVLNYPLGQATAPPPSNIIFRREMTHRVGGFEESFRGIYEMYEDQAFLTKVYLTENVYVSDECWDKYRQHADSCVAVLTRQGHYHAARRFFLEWFGCYLRERQIDVPEVWQALQIAWWSYSPHEDRATFERQERPLNPSLNAKPALLDSVGDVVRACEGSHDLATCDAIAGWAWDPRQPDTPIAVSIYADETLLVTLTANRFRRDLVEARKGNGYHAFTCPLPLWLKNGQPHQIRVKVAGSSFDLACTPKIVNCACDPAEK